MRPIFTHGSLLAAVLAAAAALLLYLPVLEHGWINWDDTPYVTANELLTAPDGLRRIWTEPQASPQYYPLTFTSYWLEHRLWGADPHGYHAANIGLHALSAALAVLLLRALGLSPLLAGAAGLLFATAPLQVMSVAWIAERKNTLSTPLALLALLCWAAYFARQRRFAVLLAANLAACAALLAKTAWAPLPIVAAAAGLMIFRCGWSRIAAATGLPLVLALVLSFTTVDVEQQYNDLPLPTWWQRLLIAPAALLHYVRAAVLPIQLSTFYPAWNVWTLGLVSLGVLLILGLLLGARWRALPGVARWGLFSFVLLLLPALGLIPFGNMSLTWISDHFAYYALVPFYAALVALLAAGLGRITPHGRGIATVIAVGGAAAFAMQTRALLPEWRDDAAFWNALVQRQPEHFLGYVGRAEALARAGDRGAALNDRRKAVRLEPRIYTLRTQLADELVLAGELAEAQEELRAVIAGEDQPVARAAAQLRLTALLLAEGRIEEAEAVLATTPRLEPVAEQLLQARAGVVDALLTRGRLDEAEQRASALIADFPKRALPHHKLAEIAARRPVPPEITPILAAAYAAEPGSARAALDLATSYFNDGRHDDAERTARSGLTANPDNRDLLRWLARFYRDRNQPGDAEPLWRRYLELEPDDADALFALAESLHRLGRPADALPFYERLLERRPDEARYWNNYGSALLDARKPDEATPRFKRALELDPLDAKAWYNLGVAEAAGGDRRSAIERMLKAVELNPQYGRAHDVLTRLLMQERRYREAADRCNIAINNMGLENTWLLAARFARIMSACPDDAVRDPQVGLRAVTRIMEGWSNSPDVLDAASIAHAAVGEFEQALSLAQRAQEGYAAQKRDLDAVAVAERMEIFRNRQVYVGD